MYIAEVSTAVQFQHFKQAHGDFVSVPHGFVFEDGSYAQQGIGGEMYFRLSATLTEPEVLALRLQFHRTFLQRAEKQLAGALERVGYGDGGDHNFRTTIDMDAARQLKNQITLSRAMVQKLEAMQLPHLQADRQEEQEQQQKQQRAQQWVAEENDRRKRQFEELQAL